jgi:hypothetical protein
MGTNFIDPKRSDILKFEHLLAEHPTFFFAWIFSCEFAIWNPAVAFSIGHIEPCLFLLHSIFISFLSAILHLDQPKISWYKTQTLEYPSGLWRPVWQQAECPMTIGLAPVGKTVDLVLEKW